MKSHRARINWKRLYTPLVQHNGDVSQIPRYRFHPPDIRPDPELALAMAKIAFSRTTMIDGRPRYSLCDTQLRALAMHQPIPDQGRWLAQVVKGYFGYHAVPLNGQALGAFRYHVTRLLLRTLRRRSQKDRFS